MFKNKQFSNLRLERIKGKEIFIVDRHQFTLPIWAHLSLKTKMRYELVSIDYHPDTQPPFWQKMQLKAINKNPEDIDALVAKYTAFRLSKVDRENALQLIEETHELNNDEHIYTAIELAYLTTYHMINCMDQHEFDVGRHYLVKEEYFGTLGDAMFDSIGFKVPYEPFILDIDLDYFLERSFVDFSECRIFKTLVERAAIITVARSIKYFNYLRRDTFEIEECEEMLLELINTLL